MCLLYFILIFHMKIVCQGKFMENNGHFTRHNKKINLNITDLNI